MTFLANYSSIISLYSHGLWPTDSPCCCRTVCVSFGENVVQMCQYCSKMCSWSEGSQHGRQICSGYFTCFFTHERHWTKPWACLRRQWSSECNQAIETTFKSALQETQCQLNDVMKQQQQQSLTITQSTKWPPVSTHLDTMCSHTKSLIVHFAAWNVGCNF